MDLGAWLADLAEERIQWSLADTLEQLLKEPYERKYNKQFRNFHVMMQHPQLTQEEVTEVGELHFLIDALKKGDSRALLVGDAKEQAKAFLQHITEDEYIAEQTKQTFRVLLQDSKFISDLLFGAASRQSECEKAKQNLHEEDQK